jgi:hypothetical protein
MALLGVWCDAFDSIAQPLARKLAACGLAAVLAFPVEVGPASFAHSWPDTSLFSLLSTRNLQGTYKQHFNLCTASAYHLCTSAATAAPLLLPFSMPVVWCDVVWFGVAWRVVWCGMVCGVL